MKNELALDDSMIDAHAFSRKAGEMLASFLLLNTALEASYDRALARLKEWPRRLRRARRAAEVCAATGTAIEPEA